MPSLTVFGGVDSCYTWERCLDNSRLSKALISKKWHDRKYEIFTTAGLSNTEIWGLYTTVEVLLNSMKGKVGHVFFWTTLKRFSKCSVVLLKHLVWISLWLLTLRKEYFRIRCLLSLFCFCFSLFDLIEPFVWNFLSGRISQKLI
jgi:hypothetical protein